MSVTKWVGFSPVSVCVSACVYKLKQVLDLLPLSFMSGCMGSEKLTGWHMIWLSKNSKKLGNSLNSKKCYLCSFGVPYLHNPKQLLKLSFSVYSVTLLSGVSKWINLTKLTIWIRVQFHQLLSISGPHTQKRFTSRDWSEKLENWNLLFCGF